MSLQSATRNHLESQGYVGVADRTLADIQFGFRSSMLRTAACKRARSWSMYAARTFGLPATSRVRCIFQHRNSPDERQASIATGLSSLSVRAAS